ncbi:MAG: pilus assembly FimT family protein [Stellaceae bacterium]
MWRSDRQLGFTLIELLIVLAILAAATAWFASGLRPATASAELRAETRELRAALEESRSLALTGNRVTALVVNARRGLYRGPDGVHRVARGVSLRLGGDMDTIYFFPDGSSSGGEVVLSVPRASETVSVDWFTGRAVAHALSSAAR